MPTGPMTREKERTQTPSMNVFKLRDQLVADYGDYINSFIHIKDQRIFEKVNSELTAGLLWPDPLIQLNPSFEPGATIITPSPIA